MKERDGAAGRIKESRPCPARGRCSGTRGSSAPVADLALYLD
jgi:hypothetical protein